jgi:hypothetical protein
MICSPEEAKSILSTWGASNREVRGVIALKGLRMAFVGTVSSISELTMAIYGEPKAELIFDLTGASCQFGDKREVSGDTSFNEALSLALPNGVILFLAAKPEPSEGHGEKSESKTP